MMERTVAQIIGAPSFQADKASHDINNINPGKNLLYGILADQGSKYKWKVRRSARHADLFFANHFYVSDSFSETGNRLIFANNLSFFD